MATNWSDLFNDAANGFLDELQSAIEAHLERHGENPDRIKQFNNALDEIYKEVMETLDEMEADYDKNAEDPTDELNYNYRKTA